MTAEVEITRKDHDAWSLRREAARADDVSAARRMLALALVLDGKSRTQAAQSCGMDRQTLRDWVHRYNGEGLLGLCDRARAGRPPHLNAAQTAEIAKLVEDGPDLAAHGVVRWRRIDLKAEIKARFGVDMAEQSVGALLRRLGFRKISARPAHPQGDANARASFKKTSPTGSPRRSRGASAASRSKSGSSPRVRGGKPASVSKAR